MLARQRPPPAVTVPVAKDGIYELPEGKIAAVATYLEMLERPASAGAPLPDAARFEPLGGDVARYRGLYETVGRDWLWFSRAVLKDRDLSAIIDHPEVDARALVVGGRDVGLVEIDFRKPGECELAFLGLVPDAIGQRWGDGLAAQAIRSAFARPIRRLWLHTCTLDHPGALRFYMRMGFRPYRRAVEIAADPRLVGPLPIEAAPGFPVV